MKRARLLGGIVAGCAAATMAKLAKRRREGPAPRGGPPSSTGAPHQAPTVIDLPGGDVSNDPDGQWADDGGGGIGGGQYQR